MSVWSILIKLYSYTTYLLHVYYTSIKLFNLPAKELYLTSHRKPYSQEGNEEIKYPLKILYTLTLSFKNGEIKKKEKRK